MGFTNFLGDSIDLFVLLFGQSNALGSTNSEPPIRPELLNTINNAYIYNSTQYELLKYPDNNDGLLFGCELSLAFDYTFHTDRNIYIEKHAVSGSPLAQEEGRTDWNVLSDELILLAEEGLTRLKDKAIELGSKNAKFITIWIQGERDARTDKGSVYEANFNAVLNRLNIIQPLDLNVMNILNIGIVANGSGLTTATVNSVISAQKSLVSNNKNMIALDMINYELGSDDLHFTAEAQQLIGDDLFKMIMQYFNLQ